VKGRPTRLKMIDSHRFLQDCCVKEPGKRILVTEVASHFMEWSKNTYGINSVLFRDPRKYTASITKALEA